MKRFIRDLIGLAGFCIVIALAGFIGWAWRDHRPKPARPSTRIIDQVKNIQRQVGCSKVDGIIGPETTYLVNITVKNEQQKFFNEYAARYMTGTGAPSRR